MARHQRTRLPAQALRPLLRDEGASGHTQDVRPRLEDEVLETNIFINTNAIHFSFVLLKRYVPFGHGFATVILPQLRRNDNSLFLWNACRLDFPVHCFYGHRDVILDFDWRRCGDGGYQMV